ncbi:MAG: aldehyde dehydrogenase family protein [Ignavibacteriae bacterium]|nr:MAG: aldehyde dehydrogenase family protein [Ignavibacteriota bacterium]
MTFYSVDPATEDVIASYPAHTHEEVDAILSRADEAQRSWARVDVTERALVIRRLGEVLVDRADEAAALISAEMGKPLSQARAEVVKCATACSYMADHATLALRDEHVATEFASSIVRREPMGLVLSIMPWNFPFWQFFRFAAPALVAGNGVLLKHAPTTMGCALLSVEICRAAGVPPDLVACVIVDVPDVERIIADRRVRAVTFTGSTLGGRAIGALAGKYVKKSVLELGGSDAYVILDDADVELAVHACIQQRFLNTGQSCIAAKRYIVHHAVADVVQQRILAELNTIELGPLARRDLKETLLDQVRRAVDEGATLYVDGEISDPAALDPGGRGFFVKAGLLVNVAPGSVADQEELFGPVASMIVVNDDREAIAVANGNAYGLGAAVFTRDQHRADTFVRELQAGSVFVNGAVRSDTRLPFGGVKDSGYGRELGMAGLMEFVNIKTVVEV